MTDQAKVSVVIPVYNVERYLKECMNSVIHQTLTNIEIICVNDGSTDRSLQILEDYARHDSRIKVISKPNSGYGNTMNVGIDHATGTYIGIVESDDYIEKNMFERLYNAACKYHAEVVKSDHYSFATQKGKKQRKYQEACPQEYYKQILNADTFPEIFDFAMMNWSGIYRRDFIETNHIRHNETPGASFQDNGFWFQITTLAKRIVFLPEAFYYYRQDNPNSSINNKNKVFCICEEYAYIQKFLECDRERMKQYFVPFFRKKFFNYLNTYHKIEEEHKVPFLQKVAKEFENDMKNPYLEKEKLDAWILSMANRMIDCPELFDYEDRQYVLQKEYDTVHSRLMEIRRSNEFQKGIAIQRRLHIGGAK